MPIDDASSVCSEKSAKSTIAKDATTTNENSTSKGNAVTQLEMHQLLNTNAGSGCSSGSATPPKVSDNALIKHQGQKWQQIFDFEKMLKQIRISEKQNLRENRSVDTSDRATSSNSKAPGSVSSSATVSQKSSLPASKSFTKGGNGIKQVQRLQGGDMHYYGIVPKQTALDVVVCSICTGIYTKMGFQNHMMLQHPTVWSTISNKVSVAAPSVDLPSVAHTSADSIRSESIASAATVGAVGTAEIVDSPTDMSGTMSTSSNNSTTSSTASSAAVTPSRHKSSKNGSAGAVGSSSGSGSGGRSRSKTKHHHTSSGSSSNTSSSPSVHHSAASTASAEAPSSSLSSRSSKKSLAAVVATIAMPVLVPTVTSKAETAATTSSSSTDSAAVPQPLSVYLSSSSNSSCSLPSTPKCTATASGAAEALVAAAETAAAEIIMAISPAGSLSSKGESRNKQAAVDTISAIAKQVSPKKKAKSPSFIGQESADSIISSSSSEYERLTSTNGTVSSSPKSAKATAPKTNSNSNAATTKGKTGGKDLRKFEAQISELDQAVSSITGGEGSKSHEEHKANDNSMAEDEVEHEKPFMEEDTTPSIAYKMESTITMTAAGGRSGNLHAAAVLTASGGAGYMLQEIPAPTEVGIAAACDEALPPHNSSDDNSILTLEDMLDSKFINEILNTAESEIHFDENELDVTSQQNGAAVAAAVFLQPPATKRMRFNETSAATAIEQQQPPDIAVDLNGFHQQQQEQLQQFPHYDVGPLEDMKAYNPQHQDAPMDAQYHLQQQLTSIDAMQLQQLLYQQQQQELHPFANSGIIENQQASQHYDHKQIIDLCTENNGEEAAAGTMDTAAVLNNAYAAAAAATENAYAAHFQIFNVPSLTDDATKMEHEVEQMPHYVAAAESSTAADSEQHHLIYEITDNNQVAVMSQQRQQQVIAEFLTQAGYESVNGLQSAHTSGNTLPAKTDMWDEADDLQDYDFSQLDTAQSLGTNAGSVGIKSEYASAVKYHDDFYFNVFLYTGVPRPLAINSFGLIKLPQAAATTFRKHLLTTRKANNSPITLGGCLNGVVGANAVTNAGATRFASVSAKTPAQSYFTALAGGVGASSLANEFSIGSITITNSPAAGATTSTLTQHQSSPYAHQQKQPSGGSPLEISFNATTNGGGGGAMSPLSALHRSRAKSGAAGSPVSGGGVLTGTASLGKNKTLSGSSSTPVAVVTPTARLTAMRPNAPATQNTAGKTIFVSAGAAVNGVGTGGGAECSKFVKRSLIARTEANKKLPSSAGCLTAKQIAELLSVGVKGSPKPQQQSQQAHSTEHSQAVSDGATAVAAAEVHETKLRRVQRFYERRRKLFSTADISRQHHHHHHYRHYRHHHIYNHHHHQQQQQQQQQLIKQKVLKQQLLRTLSDCGISNIAHSKFSGSSSNPGGSGVVGGDIMRVYV